MSTELHYSIKHEPDMPIVIVYGYFSLARGQCSRVTPSALHCHINYLISHETLISLCQLCSWILYSFLRKLILFPIRLLQGRFSSIWYFVYCLISFSVSISINVAVDVCLCYIISIRVQKQKQFVSLCFQRRTWCTYY